MEETTIDLREVLDIILRNIKLIGKITIGCIILAVLYLLIASPVYESESLLRIKQQQGLGSSLLDVATGGSSQMTQQQMSTYAEILKSRSVVIPVIEKTEEKEDDKYPEYETYVKDRITTVPFKNTEILKVSVTAKTPENAQQANKLLVEGFLDRLTNLSRTEQKATRTFLEGRTTEAKEDLDKAESKLQAYKSEHKIISPTDSAKYFTDKVTEIDKQAAANQVELEAAQAQLAAINGQLGGEARTIADNATIKQYNAQLAELETKKIAMQDKYTAKHPLVIDVQNQITALKEKIKSEINQVASLQAPSDNMVHQNLLAGKFQSEGAIAVAQQKAEALRKLQEQSDEELSKLPEVEQGYIKVARDASVAGDIYIMLAKRLEEAKVAEVMVSNDVQVVDLPTLPEKPIQPRKGLTLFLAVLLGLIGGSAFVTARELLNQTIRTEEDVQKYLALPVLGAIPEESSLVKAMEQENEPSTIEKLKERMKGRLWKKINLTAYTDPKSPVSEAYRTIRTNLQFAGVDKPLKTILLTSATPNEGKSTVIASLAIVMAQAGHKVVLLDCDFRNPTQHKMFGLPNKGLSNCVATDGDYHEILQHIDQENLDILTSGPVAPNPSEILMSHKMSTLLERLKEEYDYVLIDTPPVMLVTDAAAISSKVDGIIMVVASKANPPSTEIMAKERLEQAGARILGCVLNKVEVAPRKYGSSYGYGYYYGGQGEKKTEE